MQGFPCLAHELALVVLVCLRNGGKVDHLPVVAFTCSFCLKKASGQIIGVPASVHHNDAPAGRKAGVECGRVPVPDILSDGRRISRHAVFHGVIDYGDGASHASQATAHASTTIDPFMVHNLENVRVAQVGALGCRANVLPVQRSIREQLLVQIIIHDALDISIHATGEV